MQCGEEGCEKEAWCRGFCPNHYTKRRRRGVLQKLEAGQLNQDKRTGRVLLCGTCLKNFYRCQADLDDHQGDAYYCSPECWYNRPRNTICLIEGCGNPKTSRDFCKKHYSRLRRNGDPLVTKHEPNGSPNIKSYRKKRVGDRRLGEHQYVAEQLLRRRLNPGENVHHRNGKKLDNDPSNLILFPSMSAHRQYENRYREYLEMCLREGFLVWDDNAPVFEFDEGVLLSAFVKPA